MNTEDLFAADGWLCTSIAGISDFIWTYILIAALVCCGLYFTFRTRFVQFRMVGEMFRLLSRSSKKHDGKGHISSFQAFSISLSAASWQVGICPACKLPSSAAVGNCRAGFQGEFIPGD